MTAQTPAPTTTRCPSCLRSLALLPHTDATDATIRWRGRCTGCGAVSVAVDSTGEDGLPGLQLVLQRRPSPTTEPARRKKVRR